MDIDAVATAGDCVTYALECTDGRTTRHWTLEVSLHDALQPDAHASRTADFVSGFVRTYDGIWQRLTDERTMETLMRYSTWTDVQVRVVREESGDVLTQRVPTQLQNHVWQQSVGTMPQFGVYFLFDMLMRVRALLDELVSVVKTPSIASVLANGMRIYVNIQVDDATPIEVATVDTPLGPLPAFWLPVRLLANGQLVLECRALITWRRSPLLLSLGLLRIEGHHPDDPTRTVTARLVGAVRGVRDQTIDRADLGPPGIRAGMNEDELLAIVGGTAGDRFRVHYPDGTPVDLVAVDCSEPAGHYMSLFIDGRLRYFEHAGLVGAYLEHRGVPRGVYKPENRVR